MNEDKKILERRDYQVPEGLWGCSITYTKIMEDGTIWIGNDEYETQVNFCPMTGEPAKKKMTEGKSDRGRIIWK